VLKDDGEIGKNELYDKIVNPKDPHRKYLAGDTIPLIRDFFRRKGSFLVGLYELEDEELEEILIEHVDRVRIILSNTGLESKKWDGRNKPARKKLIDAGADIQHRMFNNATHIGHNKFVVHLSPQGAPKAVLTGSTNWTSTGIAGQTNNALVIEDAAVARFFGDYWQRMHDDKLKAANPFSKPMNDNQQSLEFRESNYEPFETTLNNGAKAQVWFSPNMPQRKKPTSKTKPPPTPPDLAEVYRRMRQAKEAILFLAFYPGQSGRDCIVGEAIEIGEKDTDLIVTGAVSSAQAMPNYVGDRKEDGVVVEEGDSPATYGNDAGNVTIVRASRIEDRDLLEEFGQEQLTAKGAIGAIIHDKLVVIDPLSDNCCVILGSHNLGYKASYSNDENMVIVTGDRALAEAYAVHILDVYDHYRFRAIEAELRRKGKSGKDVKLETDDSWQEPYLTGEKGALSDYFALGSS
jgi:phosphatidylserine/phosphatidylglycerophosphate/cardiolipin synthase-like enzyme